MWLARRCAPIIEVDWNNEQRSTDINDYLVDPDSDSRSRRKAFLGGWTKYLNNDTTITLDSVHWVSLGMVYASILGDIPRKQREGVYRTLLGQFLFSDKMSHYAQSLRLQALRQGSEHSGTNGQIYEFCVYTIRQKADLDDSYRRGGHGEFTENSEWVTGRRLFHDAERRGYRMPVLFAPAETTDTLIYQAILNDVRVDTASSTTTYEFRELHPIEGDLPLSTLQLRSTGRPLSDRHIRPYAICITPAFVE